MSDAHIFALIFCVLAGLVALVSAHLPQIKTALASIEANAAATEQRIIAAITAAK